MYNKYSSTIASVKVRAVKLDYTSNKFHGGALAGLAISIFSLSNSLSLTSSL